MPYLSIDPVTYSNAPSISNYKSPKNVKANQIFFFDIYPYHIVHITVQICTTDRKEEEKKVEKNIGDF